MNTFAPALGSQRIRTLLVALMVAVAAAVAVVAPATSSAAVVSGTAGYQIESGWYGYVLGLGGSISATSGASRSGSVVSYTVDVANTSFAGGSTGSGTIALDGVVRYQVPAHGVDVTVTDPEIVVSGGDVVDVRADVAYLPYGSGTLAHLTTSDSFLAFSGATSGTATGATTSWSAVTSEVTADSEPVFYSPFGGYVQGDPFGAFTVAVDE